MASISLVNNLKNYSPLSPTIPVMIQEIANNLWQSDGVAGLGIWESNSKFHLFTKRRLTDWEEQAIGQIMTQKIAEYAHNADLSHFHVMGNYARLYMAFPFPPLVVLTQSEFLQLPDIVDLYFHIQQDFRRAIAIFHELSQKEAIRANRQQALSRIITNNQQNKRHILESQPQPSEKIITTEEIEETKEIEEIVTFQEVVDTMNELLAFCAKYIGPTMTTKYLEKNRPDATWLSKFQIDKNLTAIFNGNLDNKLSKEEKEAIQVWLKGFIQDSSSIFIDLRRLLWKSSLSQRYLLTIWKKNISI